MAGTLTQIAIKSSFEKRSPRTLIDAQSNGEDPSVLNSVMDSGICMSLAIAFDTNFARFRSNMVYVTISCGARSRLLKMQDNKGIEQLQ